MRAPTIKDISRYWDRFKATLSKRKSWALAAAIAGESLLLPRDKSPFQDPSFAFADPRPLVARGRLIAIFFMFGFLLWATLAPLDSAIIAPGVIFVESHRKTLQHLEGGIVQEILVRDGDRVRAGQKLVVLDAAAASANLSASQGEVDALTAREERLMAEQSGAEKVVFGGPLTLRARDLNVREVMAGEIGEFEARRAALSKQIDVLEKRKSENSRAIAGLKKQEESAQVRSGLVAKESESVEDLYEKGLVTLQRSLALKRDAASVGGERDALQEKIQQTILEIDELDLQIVGLKNQQRSDIAKELRDVQTRRYEAVEKRNVARSILERTSMRASVDGKVVGLSVHTRGAVIRPGDTVLEVVPENDDLLVEARVRPEDADDVHPGMAAHVNFTAYKQKTLPTLPGMVQTISADRLTDSKTGQAYFSAVVRVDRNGLSGYKDVRLIPGLPVDIALDTGPRTFAQYLVRPIMDVLWRGMREK